MEEVLKENCPFQILVLVPEPEELDHYSGPPLRPRSVLV
jgi:hypothetical protein